MRITCRTVVFFLLLLTTAFLVALYFSFSTIIAETLREVFSSSLLVHLLFNFIIVAIVSKERYGVSSGNELDAFPTYCFAQEELGEAGYSSDEECNVYTDDLECGLDPGQVYGFDKGDSDYDDSSSDDEVDYYYGSDGYDEDDDDDDGSNGDIWWDDEDEEEYDSELEIRIEAFIAKVINGWKEEWFNDNMQT